MKDPSRAHCPCARGCVCDEMIDRESVLGCEMNAEPKREDYANLPTGYRGSPWARRNVVSLFLGLVAGGLFSGCLSTSEWRDQADRRAEHNLDVAQNAVRGSAEVIVVETPADTLRRRLLVDQGLLINDKASLGIRDLKTTEHWNGEERLKPDETKGGMGFDTTQPMKIRLDDAVKIAARNSRDYQVQKESLFKTALALDLEDYKFRTTFSGMLASSVNSSSSDGDRSTGSDNQLKLGMSKAFQNGTEVASSIAVDLAGMLTGDKDSAWGLIADASISIPLLRGSGKLVTMESLTQAQRNLVYEVRSFEQYKRDFMVNVANSYLGVLLLKRTMLNEEENYKRVIISTRRSRRLADASRMSLSDFDQSHQSELSARNGWKSSCQAYETSLESFKILMGLPPDARLELSDADLTELQDYVARFAKTEFEDYDLGDPDQPINLALPESVDEGELKGHVEDAIRVAFEKRPDFRTYLDRVEDAQRHVAIAEDGLRAELTLGGSASVGESVSAGSAAEGNGDFKVSDAKYGGVLKLDLPFDRTHERNTYRNSLLQLEDAVRAYQAAEDGLKQSVRNTIRELRDKRERLVIQFLAVSLAERRVSNNDLLLRAGRAEMRDVLDAQAALLAAQNSLYASIRGYRVNELELMKELGILDVTIDGAWQGTDLDAMGLWTHTID